MFRRCLFIGFGVPFFLVGGLFFAFIAGVFRHVFAGVFCHLPFHPRVGNSMRCVLTLHSNRASSNSVFPTLRQTTSF